MAGSGIKLPYSNCLRSISWVNDDNCIISSAAIANDTVQGNGLGVWTSTNPYLYDGYSLNSKFKLEWIYSELIGVNTNHMVGVTNISDVNNDYFDIDFNLYIKSGNKIAIFENGAVVYNPGTDLVSVGDTFKVEGIGGIVKYYHNDSLVFTSSNTPSFPVKIKSCFNGHIKIQVIKWE